MPWFMSIVYWLLRGKYKIVQNKIMTNCEVFQSFHQAYTFLFLKSDIPSRTSCIFTNKTILWLYVFILKSIPSNAESGSESEDSNHNKNIVKTTTAIVEPKRKLSKRISKTNMKIEKSSPKQTNSNINQIEEISKKSKQLIFIFVVTFYLR